MTLGASAGSWTRADFSNTRTGRCARDASGGTAVSENRPGHVGSIPAEILPGGGLGPCGCWVVVDQVLSGRDFERLVLELTRKL